MTALIVCADARALPLLDATVDLIVTSPPYFGLRSYQDGGTHYAGQIGSEETPQLFLLALLDATREMMRVLKPAGSLFINLGDKYGPSKTLLGLPWRFALRCIDDLGLTLRAEVIWQKPNGLPESVTDRVRRSHEQWFHFTKQQKYYAAIDELREPHTSGAHGAARAARSDTRADLAARWPGRHDITRYRHARDHASQNPLGRLPGSVWEIASQPLIVPAGIGADHFAAFPVEWPRRIITGWCPPAICTACYQPRKPVYVKDFAIQNDCTVPVAFKRDKHYAGNNWHDKPRGTSIVTAAGHQCGCSENTAATRPAVVLDPFGGTGTTALAAKALGRTGISVDMSADYCRIASWRTADPAELAKAMRVDRPPSELDGQADLFELLTIPAPSGQEGTQ